MLITAITNSYRIHSVNNNEKLLRMKYLGHVTDAFMKEKYLNKKTIFSLKRVEAKSFGKKKAKLVV